MSSLLEQFRFHERWRGYDPSEVDAYVEKVIRVVSDVQVQLKDLQAKLDASAANKDHQIADLGAANLAKPANVDVNEAAHGIAKTLELAQNAADVAVADAHQQAEQMLAEATNRREQAEQEATELIEAAKSEAHKIREELQRSLAVLSTLLTSPESFRVESTPELQANRTDTSEVTEAPSSVVLPAENIRDDDIEPVAVVDIIEPIVVTDAAEQQPRLVTRADLAELDEVQSSDPRDKPEEEPILAQLRETASRDQVSEDDSDAASAFFNEDEEQKSRSWFLGRR